MTITFDHSIDQITSSIGKITTGNIVINGGDVGSAINQAQANSNAAFSLANAAFAQANTAIPSVTSYGVTGNGTTDDTANLQTAITSAANGSIIIPPGNYLLSNTILASSNTNIIGSGHGTRFFTTAGTGFNFIKNVNFNATFNANTKVDQNISVSNIFFDYGSLNDGGTHAVSFRMLQNGTVRDCFFNGGNDGTAMLACIGTLVENCYGTNLTNCAYDHWDGAKDFTVRKCYASMLSGNGLLATGVDTTGVLPRTTDGGLFEDVEIHGGGVGLYMNAGYANCAVWNVTVKNLRFYGTNGGVVTDGMGGRHVIENILWSDGGNANTGDCAVRLSASNGQGPPNDCFIDKIHVANCVTASAAAGILQIGGLRHEVGSASFTNSAISSGTAFWFDTNSNGSVLRGPVFMDPASISGITFGLYQGNGGAFDTNTQINCWDPFNGFYRHEGAQEVFEQGILSKGPVSVYGLNVSSYITSAYNRANTLDGIGSIIVTATGGVAVGGGSTQTLTANGTVALTANAATTSAVGVVQLNNTVTSNSTTQAATANAVFTAMTTAAAAFTQANSGSAGIISSSTEANSYTFALGDLGTVVEITANVAANVTVPNNATVGFTTGSLIQVLQYGTGKVTLVPAGSVTLRTPTGTLSTRAQYSTISLRQRVSNEWIISGDLA